MDLIMCFDLPGFYYLTWPDGSACTKSYKLEHSAIFLSCSKDFPEVYLVQNV
jgi:hypothetical protein